MPTGLISLKLYMDGDGFLLISVSILLCRKAAYLLVIISMRLKIDQVMLRDSIVIADKDYQQDGVQDIILMRLKLEII